MKFPFTWWYFRFSARLPHIVLCFQKCKMSSDLCVVCKVINRLDRAVHSMLILCFLQSDGKTHTCSILGKIACLAEVYWSPELFRTVSKQVFQTKFWIVIMWILQWAPNMWTSEVCVLLVEESCAVWIRVAKTKKELNWKSNNWNCLNGRNTLKLAAGGRPPLKRAKQESDTGSGRESWLPCLQPAWTLVEEGTISILRVSIICLMYTSVLILLLIQFRHPI